MLEPGTGIGSFRMLMPESVASTSKFTGIEFDGPTALIAAAAVTGAEHASRRLHQAPAAG